MIELAGKLRRLALGIEDVAEELRVASQPSANVPVSAAEVRAILRVRRERDELFGIGVFADPAWDILLELFAARLEGKPVAVSSLCVAAAVPATTALRWIKQLTEMGLICRVTDPMDGRRVFIEISDHAGDLMNKFVLESVRQVAQRR